MYKSNIIKSILLSAALILGGFFSLKIIDWGGDDEIVISVKEYLLSSFLAELPEINKNLPHKLDENTVLLYIKYEGAVVVSAYQLLNSSLLSLNDGNFSENSVMALQKQGCLNETKKRLIDVDVDFLERYQDSNGKLVAEFSINKTICSSVMR